MWIMILYYKQCKPEDNGTFLKCWKEKISLTLIPRASEMVYSLKIKAK